MKEQSRFCRPFPRALSRKRNLRAASLSHGDQRKLEVGVLIALNPAIYMFDEPTAGMSVDEVPVILDLLRRLKTEAHKTILLGGRTDFIR